MVAGRLAENRSVSVLLIEAGESDAVEAVTIAAQWPLNLGSERSWNYVSQPNANLNGRVFPIDAARLWAEGRAST